MQILAKNIHMPIFQGEALLAPVGLAAATGAFVPAPASIATLAETLAQKALKANHKANPHKQKRFRKKPLPMEVVRWGVDIGLSQLCWMCPHEPPYPDFAHICIIMSLYGMNDTANFCHPPDCDTFDLR